MVANNRHWGSRHSLGGLTLALALAVSSAAAQETAGAFLDQAQAQRAAGDWAKARATLEEAARRFPQDLAVAEARAKALDAAGDSERRNAYARWVALQKASGQAEPGALRRLAILSLLAGDRAGAEAAGLKLPAPPPPAAAPSTIHLPGPLNAFRRLAAISSQTPDAELLAALSRNVFTLGYHYSQRLNKTTPTEFLLLLQRYVGQARDLEKLAGPEGELRVTCEGAGPLLKILGYRFRKGAGCGPNAVVETEDPPRAFLTIDAAFPLPQMEAAFRAGQAFVYSVKGTGVPVLFGVDAWFEKGQDPLDQLLDSKEIARTYYALTKLESRTAEALRQSPGLAALREVAPVLDFYGSSLAIRDGRVTIAGGPERLGHWAKLIDEENKTRSDPSKPAEFLHALVEKDNGWLVAFADSLLQLDAAKQNYYFTGDRLERFYKALRGGSVSPGSARPVFRPNAELLLLPTRLRLGADGQPVIPGGPATWKTLFQQAVPKGAKGAARSIPPLNNPDDVLAALYSKVRLYEENGLLNIFIVVNEIDRRRTRPIEPNTVLALARDYARFSHHYSLFADWPEIPDATILKFLKTCEQLVGIKNNLVKGDALGSFQGLVSLWDIFARQGQIPESALGSSLDAVIGRFGGNVDKADAAFDAARSGLETLLAAVRTGVPVTGPGVNLHEAVVSLVAGVHGAPYSENAHVRQARDAVLNQISNAMDSQRLIRLDTVLNLADGIDKSAATRETLLRLAGQLREFRIPHVYVSAAERNAAFPGYWTERHLDQMRDIDVGELMEKKKRGMLLPFLRDTLVGFSYAYYAPPGAQVLYNNPLFVRSHDFLGRNGSGTGNEVWGPGKISGTGWPLSGGGRLVGALSGLPYGLAEAEQDFLIPQNTQALIWSDLAPQMLVSAVVPRWWQATPRQQRWVALNQRLAEDLIAEATVDARLRHRILELLGQRVEPRRRQRLEQAWAEVRVDRALELLTPAETFRLARAFVAEMRQMAAAGPLPAALESPALAELAALAREGPQELNDARISRMYGVPHPKVARSWRPELLELAPMPAMQGYSSRLLAESWESNNLYFARVADEMGLHPTALHWLAPQLTRRLIEHIFANHHEDWPAVLRALHRTGEEYRRQSVAAASAASPALDSPREDPR